MNRRTLLGRLATLPIIGLLFTKSDLVTSAATVIKQDPPGLDRANVEIRIWERSCPHESLPILIYYIDRETQTEYFGKVVFDAVPVIQGRIGTSKTSLYISPENAKHLAEGLSHRFDGSFRPRQVDDYHRFDCPIKELTCEDCKAGKGVTL